MELTLRILLERLYSMPKSCDSNHYDGIFAKPDKHGRTGFLSFGKLFSRNLLPETEEIFYSSRGRKQVNILNQKDTAFSQSLRLTIENSQDCLTNLLMSYQDWLKEDQYDSQLLRQCLFPWVKQYFTESTNKNILLPVEHSLSLYDTISYLLQPELPIQAHAEAVMWLMLYAAMGKEFKLMMPKCSFLSFISNQRPLSRKTEIDNILSLMNDYKKCKKAIILTGEPGVGKTYIAEKVIQNMNQNGIPTIYFLTSGVLLCELNQFLDINKNITKDTVFFFDNIDFKHRDDEDALCQLLLNGYRVIATARQQPHKKHMFITIPIPYFLPEQLSNYFFSQLNNNINMPQERKKELYSTIIDIAKQIQCNTDLFIQITQIIVSGAFEADEILEKLKTCQTQKVIIDEQSLSQYIYHLFFSQDSAITSDKQILYLCCMAFLPPNGVLRNQLCKIMKDIDPNDTIRQQLLDSKFLKTLKLYDPNWSAYACDQSLYYINENMRKAVYLSINEFLKNNWFVKGVFSFLNYIKDELHSCTRMCNTTNEEDRDRYLNLLFWQIISRYIIHYDMYIIKFLPKSESILNLFLAISDVFYFASIYDEALNSLKCAEDLYPIKNKEIEKRKCIISSVIGKKIFNNYTFDNHDDFILWKKINNNELWKIPCSKSKEKEFVLKALGFSELKTYQLPYNTQIIRETAEDLMHNGWFILSIKQEKEFIVLYCLHSNHMLMRRIDLNKDKKKLLDLLKDTFILPKTTWHTTPQEMIINGLKIGRYDGWGIFLSGDERLVSYVDIKILHPDEPGYAQIGFAATDVSCRSKRMTQFIINRICLEYPETGTFFTTHDQNGSMRRVANSLGYYECKEKQYNRIIDSVATLRCEKSPLIEKDKNSNV